ncbi:hypothetical protein TARUN_120 [Trichoderma arundinaceum]|uniref:Uncharacterized protein n=1 Tax=Trichoderma arundinaceum TaxID=490622 RepID=A0A395P108_TRIAR|nr:hypothetical protein TARUN_120 [Trichoderma arundinaceum]
MENPPLHGFRFRPQSPLKISNQTEADDIKADDEEWQGSPEYEIEDFDELIWQIPVPETPVNRYLSHESTIEPDEQEYSERGSDSGASTMTLIYVPEVEDDVYEMTIGSIDEDSFEGNESFEDVTSEGEAMVDRYRVESEDDDEDEDEETGDDDDEDDSEEQGEGEGEGDSELEQAGESEEAEFVMQPYGYGLDTLEGLFHDDFDYFYEI